MNRTAYKRIITMQCILLVMCIISTVLSIIALAKPATINKPDLDPVTVKPSIENISLTQTPNNIIHEEKKQETLTPLSVTATAYCDCVKCCGKSDGITCTGTKATAGRTIAVDPSVIPLGTTVIIDGHEYIAEDKGGAIKGNKIDIFFDTHNEALEFGRQSMTVYVKNDGTKH